MTIYVGTAGWSYPSGEGRWDGVFYPRGLADRDKLAFYAQYFDAVELNSSFYRPPTAQAARGWASRVPETFRFTAKIWQKFTHPKMFEQATGSAATLSGEDFDLFREGVSPLAEAGKLGALLAQFPPSFKPSDETLDYLTDLIRGFRGAGFPLAVELRHRDWTGSSGVGPAVRTLFEDEDVAWVMIDEPKFRTSIRDVPQTSGLGYFRFHGRNAAQWWRHEAAEDRYNYHYSPSEQQELAEEVRAVADNAAETYVFYNNHYRAKAVANAVELGGVAQLDQKVRRPPMPALPQTLIDEYPELAGAAGGD